MEGISPHTLFTIFGVPIRDTIVHTWIFVAVSCLLAIWASSKLRVRPSTRWQGLLEAVLEMVSDLISNVIGEGHEDLVPFLSSLLFFTIVANLLGLIPGMKTPTSNINTAAGLAIMVFFAVHYYGIKSLGLGKYLAKELGGSNLFLLPLTIIGQLSRTLSLAVRLFGNMIAGQVIVAVLTLLVPVLVPLVLQAFGILTGLIQAYVFTMLTLVYLGSAVQSSQSNQAKPSDVEGSGTAGIHQMDEDNSVGLTEP